MSDVWRSLAMVIRDEIVVYNSVHRKIRVKRALEPGDELAYITSTEKKVTYSIVGILVIEILAGFFPLGLPPSSSLTFVFITSQAP